MIGIRNAVQAVGDHSQIFKFQPMDDAFKDFNLYNYSHNSYDKEISCSFYDFAPKVFYNLRKIYGIENEAYLKSLGPENFLGNLILIRNRSLKELCSSGKSGSFFYYSYDSKFVLKTISAKEFEFFKSIIQDYYYHILDNKDTMLQRFFGLHTLFFNNIKMHFVIMNNVFNTGVQVHYKYDLKGSTFQRLSRRGDTYEGYDWGIPLKDLDYIERNEKVLLLDSDKERILSQLINDSNFLSQHNINDYSLLIGVHNPGRYCY
jgi:1-phosphatidylinositol-4-phosphate 5-kinase